MAAATIDKEMEAAVRKVLIDEAAAAAIQIVLNTPEGKAMIERLAKDKALMVLREMAGKNLLSEGEAKNVEVALG